MADANQEKLKFRHYLENGGVVDALTKVLVGLYEEPEKPSKAHVLEYVQKHLNPETSNADIQALKQENAELKQKNQQLAEELEEARKQLAALQSSE